MTPWRRSSPRVRSRACAAEILADEMLRRAEVLQYYPTMTSSVSQLAPEFGTSLLLLKPLAAHSADASCARRSLGHPCLDRRHASRRRRRPARPSWPWRRRCCRRRHRRWCRLRALSGAGPSTSACNPPLPRAATLCRTAPLRASHSSLPSASTVSRCLHVPVAVLLASSCFLLSPNLCPWAFALILAFE